MAILGNFLSATTEMVDPNTSGWAAKLNCAISLGSGGRNGDGCLKLTSVAAGEMQARTFSSYQVVPGTLYFTLADASATAQPERIGIRWLNAAGTEISVTWSLTTATAGAGWHRVSVAGVAPVGAARAQILVSSTVAGAAVIHYWENFYFGYPLRLAGNLLSFNSQSGGELDASTWAAETNCSVSRVAPNAAWPYEIYLIGGHQIALTVTANGNASTLCSERAPVTAGEEYAASIYLNPPTSGSSAWVELRYYNAAGTQLQANRATLASPNTGWYRQWTSGIAPVGAVTASLAVGITSGAAAQVVRSEGAFLGTLESAANGVLRTGNVLTMADWDFEQGVGTWTVSSGVATIARSTPWGITGGFDGYSLVASSSTATSSVLRSGIYAVGNAAGQSWRFETLLKANVGTWSYRLGVRWFNASASLISTTQGAVTPLAAGWWAVSSDFTAPAAAVSAQLELTLTAATTSASVYVDRPALFQTLPLVSVEASDATASTRLILRELEVGQLMTVWRIGVDGTRQYVRGPDGLYDGTYVIPSDSLIIEDYEAPLGMPISYRVETVSSDGTGREDRPTDMVTVAPPDSNYAWLTDPARPGRGLMVLVRTAPDWKQGIEQATYRIRGRAAPVIHSEVRGSREGDLVCWTQTDDERDALRFLLSTGNVLLWRCAPGRGEPDVYVSVGETSFPRDSGDAEDQWRLWTLPLTELDMPTTAQAGSATWTVRDVVLTHATGYDVLDRYATVFDLATDRRRA